MLNRRHLRIKVLQTLYAYYQSNSDDVLKAERELFKGIGEIYHLYLFLLQTFSELKHISLKRLEEGKLKIRPKEEDLNPNRKFVDNAVFALFDESKAIQKEAKLHKINWMGAENQEMFRKMFIQIKDSECYFEHMNNGLSGFEEDKAFAVALFKSEIANSPLLYHFLEEKSIHWLDDIDLACQMVLKTIKSANENEPLSIMPLYKDKSDEEEFVTQLFRKTIEMHDENERLIDDLTKNWELDRIAKMDILLMQMAITEMRIFTSIPTKVSLNEYIEISKYYSTPKSNGFINGILDQAIYRLKESGAIMKTGRGLID